MFLFTCVAYAPALGQWHVFAEMKVLLSHPPNLTGLMERLPAGKLRHDQTGRESCVDNHNKILRSRIHAVQLFILAGHTAVDWKILA